MQPISVPPVAGLLLLLSGATWWVRTVHRYRLSGCHDTEDMIRGEIARASLVYIVLVAGIAGLSKRPLAWRRTPKFAGLSDESPFASTMAETIAGSVCIVLAVAFLIVAPLIGDGMALLSFVSFAALGAQFLCAPLMAAMAMRRSSPRRERVVWRSPVPQPMPTREIAPSPAPVLVSSRIH